MRKFLYIVGATTLSLLAIAVVGIGVLVWKAKGLDAESKAYVDTVVPAITAHWDKAALLDRATPELRASASADQIATLFDQFARLGPLVAYEGATGDANLSYFTGTGSQISAVYQAKARYQNGEATLRLILLKRDGEWRIQTFRVDGNPVRRASQSM
jgi:hypothetical protein